MRAIITVVALAMLLATPAGVAADSPYAFAAGGGETVLGTAFSISAHLGPNGPTGYASVRSSIGTFGPFRVQGPVTCVTIVDNHATIGIQIEKASGSATGFEGQGFFFDVQDNGEGELPDLFTNSGFSLAPQYGACTYFQPSVIPVEKGNIVVSEGSEP